MGSVREERQVLSREGHSTQKKRALSENCRDWTGLPQDSGAVDTKDERNYRTEKSGGLQ